MQDENGWPDPDAPGVPERPDEDGYHWVQWPKADAPLRCFEWVGRQRAWRGWRRSDLAARYLYRGRCLTPAEIAVDVPGVDAKGLRASADILDDLTGDFHPIAQMLRRRAEVLRDAR